MYEESLFETCLCTVEYMSSIADSAARSHLEMGFEISEEKNRSLGNENEEEVENNK